MVTQEHIDKLTAAIAAGVRSVTIGGQTVTYNTAASLLEARDRLQAELNNNSRTTAKRMQSYAFYMGRGFHDGE